MVAHRFPNLFVLDHPLIQHKLTLLRDRHTTTRDFKQLVTEISVLMGYEVTKDLPTEPHEIETPLERMVGTQVAGKKLVLVPILRAGLGMVDGLTQLVPSARVGHIGMVRDHETLKASTYAERLPEDLSGRQCYVLDPMLATGGTLVAAIDFLLARGARDVTAVCLLAAPEGLAVVEQAVGDRAEVSVVVAAVDERLNDKAYIVPGLGDAGDRLYGVV